MPYLIGPNSAAITPYRKTARNSTAIEWNAKPTTATTATDISNSFKRRATMALSNRSAISPPMPERKKNGNVSAAAASWIKAPDSASPSSNSSTKTSACLRKLSPNAEKAWHQNKGAKRRVVIKDVDMALPPFDSPLPRPDFRRLAKNWRCGLGKERGADRTKGSGNLPFQISEIKALPPEPASPLSLFGHARRPLRRPFRQEPASAVVHRLRLVGLWHRAVFARSSTVPPAPGRLLAATARSSTGSIIFGPAR